MTPKKPNKTVQRTLWVLPILVILFFSSLLLGQNTILPSDLFAHSSNCQACHNNIAQENGEDASFGVQWRSSVMANASNDPYWRASVKRETMDHSAAGAAIENECATCHMPMAKYTQKQNGESGTIFNHFPDDFGRLNGATAAFAKDGVSCSVCHQIEDKNLGEPSSFTGGFHIDVTNTPGDRSVFGPFEIDHGVAHVMNSATGYTPKKSDHIQQAELCASCHTLYTHAIDENGNDAGTLAEQVPFLEWKHSDYADVYSCQGCHMKPAEGAVPISSVLGTPRNDVQKHMFRGGNFFLLSMLSKFASSLQLVASVPELQHAKKETIAQLQENAATIDLHATPFQKGDKNVTTTVVVSNGAGHKLPTAYPSRRVWIQFTLQDEKGNVLFESGALDGGKIKGNDNDRSATLFEPHYDVIENNTQVQIYEAILGNNKKQVTTGLLTATDYLKDNRIVPTGFDKKSAHDDIAVKGNAKTDTNFEDGNDEVTYRIALDRPYNEITVTAKLWYQPIGYRWAINLNDYNAKEPKQFSKMYRSMNKDESAVLLTEVRKEITADLKTEENSATVSTDTDTPATQ